MSVTINFQIFDKENKLIGSESLSDSRVISVTNNVSTDDEVKRIEKENIITNLIQQLTFAIRAQIISSQQWSLKVFHLITKKLFEDYKIIHVYGENFHLKNEIINKVSNIYKKNDYKVRIIKEDALKSNVEILDQYLNQDSLFGEKEILVIEDATDKLLDYIKLEELEKKLILISENLQKKVH